nr:hypothetical protein GCM10020093_078510 [Planobispora longispora]
MLYGRTTELAAITKLIAEAREHRRSGALVILGEAGIGKSALLEHVADMSADMRDGTPENTPAGVRAETRDGMRVLRATGVQAESTLAFAGLHQLLWPVRDRLDRLPRPRPGPCTRRSARAPPAGTTCSSSGWPS